MTTDEGTNAGEGSSTTNIDDEPQYTADDARKFKEQKDRLDGKVRELQVKFEEATKRQKEYEGINLQEVKTWKEEKAKLERELAEKDPKKFEEMTNRRISELQGQFEAEKSELAKELEKLKNENKMLAVTDKVFSAIIKDFNDDGHKLIKREIEERATRDEDGTIVFVDEKGEIIYKNGHAMTIKEFGDQLVAEYPSLAKATAVGGSKDATNGTKIKGRSGATPQSYAELQAMPDPKGTLARLRVEDPAAVQKIIQTLPR